MIQYSKIKILLIEDFADYASAIISMIYKMGCNHIDHVSCADAAIQKCRETTYDLILSDYNLGEGKDGQQVFEELLHFKIITEHTGFIMITAEKTASMVMAALESKPDSYLTKPFNRQLLKSRIDKSLEKKQHFKQIRKAIIRKNWTQVKKLHDDLSTKTRRHKHELKKIKLILLINTTSVKNCIKFLENEISERVTPWALTELGSLLYSTKDFSLAETIFKRMLMEFPSSLEGYDWLAKIQSKQNKPVEAQQTIEKAIARSPKLIKRQRLLGELAEQNGDHSVMLKAYRQAVKQGKYSAFSKADEYVKLVKSLGVRLKTVRNEDRDKLIKEANSVFSQLQSKFSSSSSTKFRGAVAHADFSSIIDDQINVDRQISKANSEFKNLDENIGAYECIEIATSLQHLGFSELAESVLEDGVEQYFDQKDFINKVKKLTKNENLVANALKVNKINNQAVKFFKMKQYNRALSKFGEAFGIAPNNINIALNRAQALLKKFQQKKDNPDLLLQAENILSDIEKLSSDDSRYKRYLELMRLSQLMLQNAES
ncbi:MAG: response regulator [Kangiellaceae bacterium]